MKKVFAGIIIVVLIVLAIVGIIVNVRQTNVENNNNNTETKEERKYEYKVFRPTGFIDPTYEFEYQNKIYHKKLNTFEEYSEIREHWTNMLDMEEKDFENKFMIITTIENTSMLGLTLDSVEVYEDTIYISLIKDEEETDNTSMSVILPRSMDRENIVCVRNYRDDEKIDMSQYYIAYDKDESFINSRITRLEKEEAKNCNYTVSLFGRELIYKPGFTISTLTNSTTDKEEFEKLNEYIYYKRIDRFSDYVKYMDKYNLDEISWMHFDRVGVILLISDSKDIKVNVDTLINENYLEISTEELSSTDESSVVAVILTNNLLDSEIKYIDLYEKE